MNTINRLAVVFLVVGIANAQAQAQALPESPKAEAVAPNKEEAAPTAKRQTFESIEAEERRSHAPVIAGTQEDREDSASEYFVALGWKLKIADVVTVFLTFGLLVVAAATAWIAFRQNWHFVRTERAYVKMSHDPPGVEFGSDEISVAHEVKNWGNTPARVTAVAAEFDLLPSDEKLARTTYDEEKAATRKAFLVKNDFIKFASRQVLRSDEKASIESYEKTLYVHGYVDYIDMFGKRHRAGYGRSYAPHKDFRTFSLDEEFEKRSNLTIISDRRFNYDRPRVRGEGNDWDEPA